MADGSVAVAELIAAWERDRPKHGELAASAAIRATYHADVLAGALVRVEPARQQEQRRREAVERMMTLCPDHRDKQREESCLACQRDEARRLAEAFRRTIMVSHLAREIEAIGGSVVPLPWEAS